MNTPAVPSPSDKPSDSSGARTTPEPLAQPESSPGLDLEEDVAPNLGGEDQMQDA